MADALSDSLECVSLNAPAVVDMPLELLDLIVLAGGWRGWFTWRAVSRRWSELPEPFRRHVCVVPDDQVTIVRGISNAPANEGCGGPVVLVRPGTYTESVRMLRDVTLVGLGEVVVRSPGWESALNWGGYTVRGVKLFDQFELQASNAGAGARVHNLTLCQRNQRQATAVYCTWGTPLLTHCRIEGTVHVAGRGAAPTVRHCSIEGSRGAGLRVVDYAGGRYEHLRISGCRTAAAHVSLNARLDAFDHNTFVGNGFDGVVRGDGAWGASLDTPDGDAEAADGSDSDDDDEVLYGDGAFESLDAWVDDPLQSR
tara:strand:+ start:891 stop:1826 length:936 start_codon:yes stop_codon:yes gene_type:complete